MGGCLRLAVLPFLIPAGGPAEADEALRTILFGSLDAGSTAFAAAGAKIALDRVDREGFVALVSAGSGVRSERGPAPPGFQAPTLVRTSLLGAALGGYQFFYDWGVVSAFAGPEAAFEVLTGDGVRPLAPRFGLRLHGEVWARPSDDTLTTATLIVGSARMDVYARLSWGYRLWGGYLGPEAAFSGDETGYRKWSVGLHATDFALGRFSFRLSGGYLVETETAQTSPYLALSAWMPL